jgi:hypothetical protein
MSNKLSTKDAVIIAINGSQMFHQKAASASPASPMQPDTLLPVHRAVRDELVKTAASLETEEPQNTLIGTIIKVAELVNQGFPAKAAAAHVAGKDKEVYAKLASLMDEIGREILSDAVKASYQSLRQEYLQKRATAKPAAAKTASAGAQTGKYPRFAGVLSKITTFQQTYGAAN